jgi:hypothetical protein
MRETLTLISALVAALALAGCGRETTSPGSSQSPSTLNVRQLLDMSGGLYVEGSLGYVRVVDKSGSTVLEKQLDPEKPTLSRDLPAGEYVLQSWQRPCDGNCGYLDPPTDRCDSPVSLPDGGKVRATITLHPGKGCDIELS